MVKGIISTTRMENKIAAKTLSTLLWIPPVQWKGLDVV